MYGVFHGYYKFIFRRICKGLVKTVFPVYQQQDKKSVDKIRRLPEEWLDEQGFETYICQGKYLTLIIKT